MNNESPLVPQGSMLEQKLQSRSRVKLAVFCVLTIHIVGLLALLLQGCKREQPQPPPVESELPVFTDTNLPVVDTNLAPVAESNYLAMPDMSTPIPPAPTVTEHVIVKGDTFSGLATKYGVKVTAIQEANPNVNPSRLQIGQKIIIPPPAPTTGSVATTPSGDSGEIIHVVKSGDTLIGLATKYGTTVKAIQSLNNLSTTRIKVGDKLRIPAKAGTLEPAPAPVPAPGQPQY